ncbi:MAG: hypothetical protein GYA48_09635 [Chloroflexi bacterium]|nr:hypothetical protein [Chloroflexota bacterium]
MNANQRMEHHQINLIRSAYDLADALWMAPEVNLPFLKKEEETVEQWKTSIHALLEQMDQVLIETCSIPVFRMGLHANLDHLPQKAPNGADEYDLPLPIREAAQKFGRALCDYLNAMLPAAATNAEKPQEDISQSIITELCQRMVELIFNEVSIQPKDIALID